MNINPLWFICILFRLTIIYILWYVNNIINIDDKYKILIKNISFILLFIIGSGFFYKALTGSNNETQISKVFWHDTRYVHSAIYLLSSLYLINGNLKIALLILFLDVIFSVLYRIIFNK